MIAQADGVKVTDAGGNLLISGSAEGAVLRTVMEYEAQGFSRAAPTPTRVGATWVAVVEKPGVASLTRAHHCTQERLGRSVFIRGPTEEAVRDAVSNLGLGGGKLIGAIEQLGDEWQALVEC